MHRYVSILLAAILTVLTQITASAQVSFFSDNFSTGSTLNSVTPAGPTATNTAYQMISQKSRTQASLAPNDLRAGIAGSTSGEFQLQALFGTNSVSLVQAGDYIQVIVTFTNFSGLLTEAGQIGLGLYNSGGTPPMAGGMNGTASTSTSGVSGGAQDWQGYVAQVNYTGANSRIMTRPAQSESTGNNQDLITQGSSSASYTGESDVGARTSSTVALVAGSTYTEVFSITLNDVNSLQITNYIYSGADTNGTLLQQFGGVATNTTYLTSTFDALAFGYFARASASSNTVDITSIQVVGMVAPPIPPIITLQPMPVSVATNGACEFVVNATGSGVTYQWHRNGTNLDSGDNISIVNSADGSSSQLIIAPATTADLATLPNGYYVTAINSVGAVNSVTNLLTLVASTNLFYSGSGDWDLNSSPSWNIADDGSQSLLFNFGDTVVFDDGGAGGTVTLVGSYLSASSVTVNEQSVAFPYTFTGSGSFAGPGNLIYIGSTRFNVNNANTYTGGTIISNASAVLGLGNANGLGTGPVTLAKAGGQMEWTVAGGASSGLGDVIVADDFTMQFDIGSSYAGVIMGNLSGTAGKTLALNPGSANTTTNERVRVYGTNTICNANIAFGSSLMSLAPYAASGSQTYNGIISGDGSVWQRGSASTILAGPSTYTGGTYTTAGGIGFGRDSTPTSGTVTAGPIGTGPLYISPENGSGNGSGTVFASGGDRTIANALQYPTNNQVLIVGGTNALTFSGPYSLKGNDGLVTNRTFQVNNTNAWTTISGVIDDASSGCGFIKTGTGTLALNNTETYSGLTTVSAGVLAGSGTIAGSVEVGTNASIGAGPAGSLGTLTISGNLVLTNKGGGSFRLSRGGTPANDEVSVGGSITSYGSGTIAVTNVGAALQVGDTFTLFSKAVTGGATMVVVGGGVPWTNNLAVDGSISVAPSPDLGIQIAGAASVSLGANIAYTITVTNNGPSAASGIVVTDSLPANVNFVSANSSGATNTARQVVWSGISLPANGITNLTLTVLTTSGGSAMNSATVTSTLTTDPITANNTASVTTSVTTVIVPTVKPTIATYSFAAGSLTITATNGVNGGTYYLLESTNIALPLAQWKTVGTNVVTTSGGNNSFSFAGTNAVAVGLMQQFYILSSTNH